MSDRSDLFLHRWHVLRRRSADLCLVLLSASLWLGGTLLAALGCMLLVGMLVANGDAETFFLHAQNLAAHYLAAGSADRLRFLHHTAALFAGLSALLLKARWPVFLRRLKADLSRDHAHD